MSRRSTRALLAVGLPLAMTALLAACGSSAKTSSVSKHAAPGGAAASSARLARIATNNPIAVDIMVSIGVTPACASSVPSGPPYGQELAPYTSKVAPLGGHVAGTDFNVDALAKCKPSLIVADDSDLYSAHYATAAKVEKQLAPTIFFHLPNPPVNAAGQVTSTWKNWLHQIADQLGKTRQANQVIANLDVRAGAIRGQVSGKTIAFLDLDSASTYSTSNNYLPYTTVYVEDLGLKNFEEPPSDFKSDCVGPKPMACYTNDLSTETLSSLDGVDAILVQGRQLGATTVSTFISNPLFNAIPAIKTGHVAMTNSYLVDSGPVAVSSQYSLVDKAFGITEYHTVVSGAGPGAKASLTLGSANNRICWAIDPTPGKGKPGGKITLSAGGGSNVTLTTSPSYSASETTYQTDPPTYQTSGCMTVPTSLARRLASSPGSVRLGYAGGHGSMSKGAPQVIVR